MTLSKTVRLLTICALGLLPACGTRVVIVRKGDPVQLAAPVKAKVWVYDKNGERIPSKATIPEGWYALPDDGAK